MVQYPPPPPPSLRPALHSDPERDSCWRPLFVGGKYISDVEKYLHPPPYLARERVVRTAMTTMTRMLTRLTATPTITATSELRVSVCSVSFTWIQMCVDSCVDNYRYYIDMQQPHLCLGQELDGLAGGLDQEVERVAAAVTVLRAHVHLKSRLVIPHQYYWMTL